MRSLSYITAWRNRLAEFKIFKRSSNFVARLEALPFSVEAAAHYGQVRAELERAGQPAGPHGMLIAAHARSAGLIVVTNNLREFDRIGGLPGRELSIDQNKP